MKTNFPVVSQLSKKGGSTILRWWTWSQCIRTISVLHFEVTISDTSNRPLYQEIAAKSLQLNQLGLSFRTIAKKLNVDEKTVSKAIRWTEES